MTSDKFYHQEITFAVLSERELRSSVGLRDLCQAMAGLNWATNEINNAPK